MLQHVGAEKLFAKLMYRRQECKRKSDPTGEKACVTPPQEIPSAATEGSYRINSKEEC
jgi:hypothetical protein